MLQVVSSQPLAVNMESLLLVACCRFRSLKLRHSVPGDTEFVTDNSREQKGQGMGLAVATLLGLTQE